jgi:hypothetical protein
MLPFLDVKEILPEDTNAQCISGENMSAAFPIDHRLALVAFAALLIAAAAPLASAWARLLPEEPPPFGLPPSPAPPGQMSSNPETRRKGDPFAIFLLLCVTLSFLLKFPGLPVAALLQSLSLWMPREDFNWLVLGARAFFVVVPGLAAVYSAIRPNPIRIPLIAAGVFVILLWLLSPMLRVAIAL